MIGRIRYEENWNGRGEHYVYEWKFEIDKDDAWRLECAYPLRGDMIHYTALTMIREWNKRGIDTIIWK